MKAVVCTAVLLAAVGVAAEIKVNLAGEQPGKPPATFEPIVGTWVVAQDAGDKVIMVDGRPWVASTSSARSLSCTSS